MSEFYCVAFSKSRGGGGGCALLFPPHLHLPAAQPLFPLPPADVIRISGLESHPGDRPPPQPPSLALRAHTHKHTRTGIRLHLSSSTPPLVQVCGVPHLSGGVTVSVIGLVCGEQRSEDSVRSFNTEVKSCFSSLSLHSD